MELGVCGHRINDSELFITCNYTYVADYYCYHHLLSQVSFPLVLVLLNLSCNPALWIKFHIVALSILCAQLLSVDNLLIAFLVLFTDFLVLQLQFPSPH